MSKFYFYSKNTKKNIKMSSAAVVISTLRGKISSPLEPWKQSCNGRRILIEICSLVIRRQLLMSVNQY